MKEKIQQLMDREGLRPSQFAARLGIKAAGISHILSGRNNPSCDMVQRILRQFPAVNPDWLLLDAPDIYRPATETPGPERSAAAPSSAASAAADLFSRPTDRPSAARSATPDPSVASPSDADDRFAALRFPDTGGDRAVARIAIFYEDGTFEFYRPTRR